MDSSSDGAGSEGNVVKDKKDRGKGRPNGIGLRDDAEGEEERS